MNIQNVTATTLITFAALLAHAVPVAAQTGSCETIKRLSTLQEDSRKLSAEANALSAAGQGGANPGVPRAWIESFQSEARTLSTNAETLARTPAKADPEVVFNLGKHMNRMRELLSDSSIQSVRSGNAVLESLARQSGVLSKDIYFILANVASLKDEAGRCGAR